MPGGDSYLPLHRDVPRDDRASQPLNPLSPLQRQSPAVPVAPLLRLLASRPAPLVVIALLIAAPRLSAQALTDTTALARIRDEGFRHSQVLETALGLSDLSPPRLAGSPGYLQTARWAIRRLQQWGIPNARFEGWGKATASWVLDGYQLEMKSPWYLHLTAFPRAWSPPTAGTIRAPIVVVHVRADSDLAALHGKLRGRIVLNGTLQPIAPPDSNLVHRFTDHELDSLAVLTDAGAPGTAAADMEPWIATLAWRRRWATFLRREGAVGLIESSEGDVLLRADGWENYPRAAWGGVPSFVIVRPEFNRLLRLQAAGQPVRLSLSLAAHTIPPTSEGRNVIAELPGTDSTLGAQVVMLGGHLDSWIAGSGATDNAAGCAVVMEVLRILHDLQLQPRRTIRIALWDAEETSDDYAGSMGYVKRHFGDWTTGSRLPEHAGLSAYFNLDNGSGRIRGIYLQGNAAARPLFASILAPLADLGADHVTLARTGETDHVSFWSVGLPGFQFIQDPLDYESRSHHSSFDVGDYLREDDLRQAAVVMATVVYRVAMQDALVPRAAP